MEEVGNEMTVVAGGSGVDGGREEKGKTRQEVSAVIQVVAATK